jgi:hypothetical protein
MGARLADLERALKSLGYRMDEPGAGSHWKVYAPDGRMYPIPAHRGRKTELDGKYVRGLCRSLGINEKVLRDLL